jgi:sphingomyelin phosphodiesterase
MGINSDEEKLLDISPPLESEPIFAWTKMRTTAILLAASVCLTWPLVLLSAASPTEPVIVHDQKILTAYTAPSAFPTSAFSSYYDAPTGTDSEPRPAITQYGSGGYFPASLDAPYPLPTGPPASQAVYPDITKAPPSQIYSSKIEIDIINIINNKTLSSCQKCVRSLQAGQRLARTEPNSIPEVLINLCTKYNFTSTSSGLSQSEVCKRTYSGSNLGAQYAQILSYIDLKSGDNSSDALYLCNVFVGAKTKCTAPAPVDLNADGFLDKWFGGKAKRQEGEHREMNTLSKKSGQPHLDSRGEEKMMKVLHLSDIHVDPRFFIGGEALCTSGQCCRSDSFNSSVAMAPPSPPGSHLASVNISEPAVYWGNYKCDSPWPLAISALESVTKLNGGTPVDFSLYTGDMVTHDSSWHLSNDLIKYTEQSIFDTMKRYLGSGPVFSAIGNHDTAPSDSASPHSVPDAGPRKEYSYDWDNLKRLFYAEGWFTHKEADQVSRHYGGYSVSPRKGLRIITLNTDFWYKANIYNYINSSNPDTSGILRFLTDELEMASRRGERVWIVGHVLTGWDGSNPMANPTNLFYQIVDHYSPRTIAHIFFGHTHEDQFNVFYSNNGTERTTLNAKAVSFMSPSITPGTNVNSALRFYHVDPETYEIMDYDQYYTQVADFKTLPQTDHGPVWKLLYSAREGYSNFSSAYPNETIGNGIQLSQGSIWPKSSPLNATFWAALTDEMLARPEVVVKFSNYQARNSTRGHYCTTGPCLEAIPCYARSGSSILGQQCPQGYGSVQS